MARKLGTGDRIFSGFNYTFLILLAIVTLYPFIWVLSASLSSPTEVMQGRVWLLPRAFSLQAYTIILQHSQIWVAYWNTLIYVIVGTAINVALTFLAAYPLSRSRFYGRGVISFIIVFTMFFGGGMIPTFLVVKAVGLLNTRWAMIIPGAISAWNLIMTRTYLTANVPDELIDAAQIDGANDFQILYRIVIQLSLPVLAVIALFYAVGHWNDYFSALLYLRDQQLMPLQVILRQIVISAQMESMFSGLGAADRNLIAQTIKYATIIVGTVPILLIYPFLQKYFVKGIMIGALKG